MQQGGSQPIIIAALIGLGLMGVILAIAIGIGSGFTPPSAGARESRIVDVTNTQEQALLSSLNIAINSCETLRNKQETLDSITSRLDSLLSTLSQAKNPDGTSKITPEQNEKIANLKERVAADFEWLNIAITKCGTTDAPSDNDIAEKWSSIKAGVSSLTDGSILGERLVSFVSGDGDDVTDDGFSLGESVSSSVPILKQGDYDDIPYPKYLSQPTAKSIRDRGCGIIAAAMVLRFYGANPELSDKEFVSKLARYSIRVGGTGTGVSGTAHSFFPKLAREFGMTYASPGPGGSRAWGGIVAALRQGKPVIVSGRGPRPFTRGGHFIVLTGISEDGERVFVNDPNLRNQRKTVAYSSIIISSRFHSSHIISR